VLESGSLVDELQEWAFGNVTLNGIPRSTFQRRECHAGSRKRERDGLLWLSCH
jgi:hypothetical protein